MALLVMNQHSWRVLVFATLKMFIYLHSYQLTDWMAHVPAEGKYCRIKTTYFHTDTYPPASSGKELPNVCSLCVLCHPN